jgi:phosphoglycolate phosphatase-like HAD superfamily hydrolase
MTNAKLPETPTLADEAQSSNALGSWHDTAAKKSIIEFVARITDPTDAGYVAPQERIATFDNDGTLWCEQPAVQGDFIMQRLSTLAEKDTSLRQTQPWKMAYEKDTSWINQAVERHYNGDDDDVKVLFAGLGKAFADMSVDVFARMVSDFFDTALHPKYQYSYLDVAYQPMLELLDYLKANEFVVYIVSGGGRDFMRVITERVYDIPPERVIGSAPTLNFQTDAEGASIMRGPGLDILDDGPAKPVQIWDRIGRRPILAAGNANGDIPMLQFAGGMGRPALRLLVSHDDDERETAYTAGAEKAVRMARDQDWAVISMKNDWRTVFSIEMTKTSPILRGDSG